MTHLKGDNDADLHHEDGTHREEPPPVRERYSGQRELGKVVRGSDMENREATYGDWQDKLAAHLRRHEQEGAGSTGTCRYCGEQIEHYPGTGWVETAVGGHYDICPDHPEAANSDIEIESMKHRPA